MSSISNNKYELRIRTRLVTHVERLNVRREVLGIAQVPIRNSEFYILQHELFDLECVYEKISNHTTLMQGDVTHVSFLYMGKVVKETDCKYLCEEKAKQKQQRQLAQKNV